MIKKIFILIILGSALGYPIYQWWSHPVYEDIKVEYIVNTPRTHRVSKQIKAGETIKNDTPYPMKLNFAGGRIKASIQPGGKGKLRSLTQQKKTKQQLEWLSGNIKFSVKKSAVPQKFDIRLPSAVAGVRGTKFSIELWGSDAKIKLPEGKLMLKTDTGEQLNLEQGQKTAITNDQLQEIVAMTAEEQASELESYEGEAFEPDLIHHYRHVIESHYGHPYTAHHLPGEGGIHVGLRNNLKAKDLTPLKELPIVSLDLSATGIVNLESLSSFFLFKLNLEENPIVDLAPLSNLPLKELYIGGTEVKDLSPIKKLRLNILTLWSTQIEDIQALANMPLQWLSFSNTSVTDITPLQSCLKLKALSMFETSVSNIDALKTLPLETLLITPQRLEGEWRQTIKSIHTLKVVGENNIDLQLKRSAHHFLNHHKTQKRKAM